MGNFSKVIFWPLILFLSIINWTLIWAVNEPLSDIFVTLQYNL